MNILFVIVLGLCFGSFANVLIYRIPRHQSIFYPRSYCPLCCNKINWYDNIPIISYLLIKGRCRSCRQVISLQYPLVELITAIIFLITYLYFQQNYITIIIYLILSFILIVAAFIDMHHQIIPDIFSLGLLMGGFIVSPWNTLFSQSMQFVNFIYSLQGALTGGLFLFIVALVSEKIIKKESMGGGDIKLIIGIGSFVGWHKVLITIFIASFLGSIVGILLIIFKIKKKSDPIPFGPFLSIGAFISLFINL